MSDTKINQDEFAQTLRRSHCSKPDRDHDCVGRCTITPKGVELNCTLCGNETEPLVTLSPFRKDGVRAREILESAGLNFDSLSGETQLRVIRVLQRDYCPGCHREHSYQSDYIACPCGVYVRANYRGWTHRTNPADDEKVEF